MFCYQSGFGLPTKAVTEEQFWALVRASETVRKVREGREALAQGDETTYNRRKKGLPLMIFIGTFDESERTIENKRTGEKRTVTGLWRNQKHVRLNGLVVADYDHLKCDVRKLWEEAYNRLSDEDKARILLVYVTPSGDGLKVVFVADINVGNLIDNQKDFSAKLGLPLDESCKDGCRGAFMTTEEDIILLDERIFSYENPAFGERYDAEYHAGHSQGTKEMAADDSGQTRTSALSAAQKVSENPYKSAAEKSFKGIPYSEIISEWWKRNGGEPQEGERNVKLYQLAVNLRAICDNNRERLLEVMPRMGLDEQELRCIVESACKEPPKGLSKPMREILKSTQKEPSFTFACWNLSRSKCEGSLKRTGNFLGCAP